MKKLFCYLFALSATIWGQPAVSPTINPLPTRQFGHPVSENLSAVTPSQASPNLVLGQEVDAPGQIAFDNSTSPPILYVADIGNNRVLAFKNPAGYTAGKVADLVIGQQDMVSTTAQGPTTALSTGFNAPTGVAVDSKGNVYVADSGNNRIMRFPAPFGQTPGAPAQPDLVIGQQGFTSGSTANEGGNCSAKTLAFANYAGPQLTSLAIDSSGNLWTTDPLNNRVLMYAIANLTANAVAPVASVVLGQNDFVTCTGPTSTATQLSKSIVVDPSGLAFDSSGNLYIADGYSRVLFFQGPTFAAQGQPANRVLGIAPPVTSGPATVYPTQYTLGAPNPSNNNSLIPPNGVFTLGNNVYVADTPQNRIVEYDIPSNWAAESTAFPSPAILHVFGQVGASTGQANQGLAQPQSYTFASPSGGAFLGTQMWVADSGNNRVLGISPNSANTYSSASVLIGQLDYIYNAPNLIVGSEVFLSGALLSGSASGVVIDNSTSTPHLYVADPGNNRILCFADARKVSQGSTLTTADMVIGQPDLKTSEINYPRGLAGQPTATGLYNPIGVAVDNNGNLYVADYGNARVLRFPAPFNQPAGQQATANLVLGQSSFTSFVQNASANSMHSPWGLALFADVTGATPLAGSLAVSDPVYNRVLIFKKQPGGDFASGQNAALVFGQSTFSGTSSGPGFGAFSGPRGIASDTSDRLYVADTANGRILEFNQAPESLTSGPTSTNQLTGLNAPLAVAINAATTELWVANTNSSLVLRYPQYDTCQLSTCQPTATLGSYGPLGLAIDASGNVIVGDASNRITFFYAETFYRNAATYSAQQPLAPGMLAIIGRYGLPMSIADGAAQSYPWPTTLADLNLTVNGVSAPIFRTSSAYGAIFFQVPYETPTSGNANFIVTQNSTGAVLGVGSFTMGQADPGFFTTNALGTAIVAAQNSDGSTNTAGNQAARGSYVVLYLTGQGPVPNAPADGQTPSGSIPTTGALVVVIGGVQLTSSQILYSGLGAFPGGWQINATIPENVAPGIAQIVVQYNGVPSNIGGTTASDGISPGPDVKLTGAAATTIAVK
jgi:uncharacterized protein (TIGR03437 family)